MHYYNFIFSCGWGLTEQYFEPLIQYLPQCTNAKLIGVGHSLGLIKLLKSGKKFSALIGINSFINFLGNNEKLCSERLLELNKMIKNLKKDPEKTLKIFFRQCDIKHNAIIADTLLSDLKKLKISYQLPNIPILLIAAKNDKIIPPQITYDNFNNKSNVKLIMTEDGQHDLISKKTRFLDEKIREFLDEIQERNNKK